jgi:DNA-binding NarL/FixJ family response regulator
LSDLVFWRGAVGQVVDNQSVAWGRALIGLRQLRLGGLMDLLRLVVADDHKLMQDALRAQLEPDGFEIVATARRGSEVLPLVARTHPDVVLLELALPELDGIGIIERLQRSYPDVITVVFAGTTEPAAITAAFAAGASAFIAKSAESALIGKTIRQALRAPLTTPVGMPSSRLTASLTGLTAREIDVLRLVALGHPNVTIGQKLFITEQTVKFHLTNLYKKLGASNRTQAASVAHARGLIQHDYAA